MVQATLHNRTLTLTYCRGRDAILDIGMILIIIIFVAISIIFLNPGYGPKERHHFVTREGYNWQLKSELPCLGTLSAKPSDLKKEAKRESKKMRRKAIRKFEKCEPRSPKSAKDSKLIRGNGFYNINFNSCYENLKMHDESGKGLTLETTCNWYWCATMKSCGRSLNPGTICTQSERTIRIILIVGYILGCFNGFAWFWFRVKMTFRDIVEKFVCCCCRNKRIRITAIVVLVELRFLLSLVFLVPVILFTLAMIECNQVYPFPVIFELFNHTNHSSFSSFNNITYSPTPTPSPSLTSAPTASFNPTLLSTEIQSLSSSNNKSSISWLVFLLIAVISVCTLFPLYFICGCDEICKKKSRVTNEPPEPSSESDVDTLEMASNNRTPIPPSAPSNNSLILSEVEDWEFNDININASSLSTNMSVTPTDMSITRPIPLPSNPSLSSSSVTSAPRTFPAIVPQSDSISIPTIGETLEQGRDDNDAAVLYAVPVLSSMTEEESFNRRIDVISDDDIPTIQASPINQ